MSRRREDLQTRVLEDLSQAVNYRRWIAGLVRPHLGDHPLEIGAGTGDYAIEWLADARRLTLTEAEEDRLRQLRERFSADDRVTVRRLVLPATATGAHSAVVALNVLEHIADDVAALRSAAGLVRPGGNIVLLVPAFPSAMSRFDRAVGHVRRYTRASLSATVDRAGLRVHEAQYINPVGLLAWYLACTMLGLSPREGLLLRAYDRGVVPLSRAVERHWRPPFGQSIFAVVRTP